MIVGELKQWKTLSALAGLEGAFEFLENWCKELPLEDTRSRGMISLPSSFVRPHDLLRLDNLNLIGNTLTCNIWMPVWRLSVLRLSPA